MSPDTAVKIPNIDCACIKLYKVTYLGKFSVNFSLKWSYYYTPIVCWKCFYAQTLAQDLQDECFLFLEYTRMLIYFLLWLIYYLILFLFPLLVSKSLYASVLKIHLFLIHCCYESMPLKLGFPLQLSCVGQDLEIRQLTELRELLPNVLALIVKVWTEEHR